MDETVIGVLHPGEMGAAVGRCLTGRGYTVLWASVSPAAAARAAVSGPRPADAHSTVCPRPVRHRPTAAPISPG